jgi:type I restriction enzyme S subunit
MKESKGFKETEIGLIPEDWEVLRLENTMKSFTPNKKLKQSDYKAIGKFPVIDQGQEYIAGFYNDETMVFDKDLPFLVIPQFILPKHLYKLSLILFLKLYLNSSSFR